MEIVAPHLSPPVALSARALSAHSEHSSPSLISSAANSPSPPLSQSGEMNPPPGSVAAQIAERLMGGSGTLNNNERDGMSSSSRSKGHRRPISDATSSAGSFRSRSPHAMGGRGVQQVLDFDANNGGAGVGTGTSSPTGIGNPNALSHSNVSAFSKTHSSSGIAATSQSVISADLGSTSPLPIATAFPSLPLPNPYRSSSPTHGHGHGTSSPSTTSLLGGHGLGFSGTPASSILNLPLDLDGSRPAASSLSIDGAVISGNEVASASVSLGGIADVMSHSEDSALSPYTGKHTPSNFSPEIQTSPLISRSTLNQGGHSKSLSSSSNPGLLNSSSTNGGLGVFDAGENSETLRGNGSGNQQSSSQDNSKQQKHRLSFFSYADIINQAEPELLDFKEAIKSSSDANDFQHGHHQPQQQQQIQEFGIGYPVNPNPSSMLNSVGMARSASSGSGINYSISPSSNTSSALRESKSGTSTPLRGRKPSQVTNNASQFLNHQSLDTKLQALKEPM